MLKRLFRRLRVAFATEKTACVHRFEITVVNNKEPSRVAREVVAHLADMRRHPPVRR
jgi:hypothetical protein